MPKLTIFEFLNWLRRKDTPKDLSDAAIRSRNAILLNGWLL